MIPVWVLKNVIAPLFNLIKKEIRMSHEETLARIEALNARLTKIHNEVLQTAQLVSVLRDALAAEGVASNAINAALEAVEQKTAAIDTLIDDVPPGDDQN